MDAVGQEGAEWRVSSKSWDASANCRVNEEKKDRLDTLTTSIHPFSAGVGEEELQIFELFDGRKIIINKFFFYFNTSSSITGTASIQRWNVNLVQLKLKETESDSLARMRDVFTFFGKMWNYFLLFSLFIIFY